MTAPPPLIAPGSLAGSWGRLPHLDAVVLDGCQLHHYRRSLARPDRPWVRLAAVTQAATGPGRLLRHRRRLYTVVPEGATTATYLLGPHGWSPVDVVIRPRDAPATPDPPFPEALMAGSRHVHAIATAGVRGRQYALADEDGSVFGYRRHGDGWERDSCLRLSDPEPFAVADIESVKLAQVTGERDATPTPWGERAPTLSTSLSTAGIRGTDLGVRVDHAGRTFLFFGDTHWEGRPWLATRDAIAEVLPGVPTPPGEQAATASLPRVRFSGSPLELVGHRAGRVTMREYDVPLDGFSFGGRLYGFFSSNHFRRGRVMGRSVLAQAVDAEPVIDPAERRRPVRFELLGTFSDRHFINASVQLRPAAAVPGCGSDGEVLLVWGSGPYRASELRLAVLDQDALAALAAGHLPRPRYWDGGGWSEAELDARPLFGPAALGEVSVRWVPAADRYLMLAASGPGEAIGPSVVLRTATAPQGPWSRRLRLLDWVTTGMSLDPHTRFLKASHEGDPVGDRIFRSQARGTGAAYAPYLFDAVAHGDDLVLRYTLSTWNPYQVVLMQHRLQLSELEPGPR